MNKIIGQILLWIGFLSGALATVFATANYSRLGMDISDGKDKTVVVKNLSDESQAYKSGLRDGDQIVSLEGKEITSPSSFKKALGAFESDSPAKFVVKKRGETESTTLSIGVRNSWSTINWVWYLASAAICIAGVCFLRIKKMSPTDGVNETQATLKQIKAHLANLVQNTSTLNKEIGDYKPRQILNFIEETLADDFRDFADGRDAITDEHGLEIFAKVMTQFAAGERAINRAWSASADGYIEEARTCVEHGLAMLQSAKKFLEAA